jgi:hypothetical protein
MMTSFKRYQICFFRSKKVPISVHLGRQIKVEITQNVINGKTVVRTEMCKCVFIINILLKY